MNIVMKQYLPTTINREQLYIVSWKFWGNMEKFQEKLEGDADNIYHLQFL